MMARVWHGVVPVEKAERYLQLMCEIAIPEYKATAGNQGAWCLRKVEGRIAHFEMLTFWEDVHSIKRFAGEDYERARYYDFDEGVLLEKEFSVRHYELHTG